MKRVGVITNNVNLASANIFFNAFKKRTQPYMIDIYNLRVAAFPKKWEVFYPRLRLSNLDAVFFRGCISPPSLLDFRLTVSEHLEEMGLDVINPSKATRICRNKFSTIQFLQRHGVPTPKTRAALTPSAAMRSIRKMKKPVIIKLLSGSHGKGVMRICSNDEAESVIDALWALGEIIYFQEYIETSGKDIRVIVLENEVIAAMERTARNGDFRSNLSRGGKGEKVELEAGLRRLALKATKAVGAVFAGVDIVVDGRPKVLEVNINPGLKISRITEVNIADRVARYIAGK
ncbi:MAG: RimK family alpha-L-glutamate ligase [Candidatus Aenigmarchaeota archaeon]|nr:RimK family alpha-L-glutamate ligase [Candidatus Aenigmarchaeota archaeon]